MWKNIITSSTFRSLNRATARAATCTRFLSTWTSSRAASPWQILGLEPGTEVEDIDIAYRKLLLQVHPDQGGTTEAFLRVKQAREVLVAQSNPALFEHSKSGLRKRSFAQRFDATVRTNDLDEAWSMWSVVMSNQLDEPITVAMCETYLQLLTSTGKEEKAREREKDKAAATSAEDSTNQVVPERWEGLLVAMDAFEYLKENQQFEQTGVEEAAWNGLLWHLAQLPRDEIGGSAIMNDILVVCKRMDSLNVPQDLELLRTHIFQGRS